MGLGRDSDFNRTTNKKSFAHQFVDNNTFRGSSFQKDSSIPN
jgi:hypothetical protein